MRARLFYSGAALALLVGCTPATAPTQPTVQAGATQIARDAAPTGAAAVGTVSAASPVQIAGVQVNPADTRISLRNNSGNMVDLSGWTLRVGRNSANLPGNARVAPGEMVTLHTGTGTSSGTEIYLGQDTASLLSNVQAGDRVALMDSRGTVVTEFQLTAQPTG